MSRKPRPILQDMPAHLKQRIADNLERYTDKMALRSFNADFLKIIGDPQPCPVLQDMPTHLKQRIAGNLERYTDKMALRSFNADFRKIIGDPQAHIRELEFDCCSNKETHLLIERNCGYNTVSFRYHPTKLGCLVKRGWYYPVHLVKNRDHAQVALEDFQSIIDNPNLTVGKFWLTVRTPQVLGILGKLIPGKLKVKVCSVGYYGLQEAVVPVLSRLDSHFLNYLNIYICENAMAPLEFDKLVKLDQWKSLERLRLCKVLSSVIPVENVSHVPIISLNLDSSLAQVPAMINQFRGSPTMKECFITTPLDISEMKNAIGKDAANARYEDGYCVINYHATNGQSGLKVVMGSREKLGTYF